MEVTDTVTEGDVGSEGDASGEDSGSETGPDASGPFVEGWQTEALGDLGTLSGLYVVNANEAYEMWAAYRDAGLLHYVPFWTRFCDPFVRAREVLDSGALGEIHGVVYRWHNPRPMDMPLTWRDDDSLSAAGSIADVGSHAYDTLRWLLGREATRVQAHADTIERLNSLLG